MIGVPYSPRLGVVNRGGQWCELQQCPACGEVFEQPVDEDSKPPKGGTLYARHYANEHA